MVIKKMVQESVQKAVVQEAVMIYINPANGQLAIKSHMAGKQETLNVLLMALNIVAMKDEESKSAIIKPTTAQVAKVAMH